MQLLENNKEIYQFAKEARANGSTIALVPTMGFLHQGHLSLVRAARQRAEVVVVSIFLNPTQFNNPADYEKYPRNLDQDLDLLRSEQVDVAFCPQVSEIYSPESETWVSVDKLSQIHEGEFRPGHFRGVTTVVNILFNIISPDVALFGEKDYQQLSLIKKMVSDLHMPIEIVGCPTIRENDGLALSSRNARLSKTAREISPSIYKGLVSARILFAKGEREAARLESEVSTQIYKSDLVQIEYVRVIDPTSFERRQEASAGDRIVLAVWIDGVRLIDNTVLD